MIRRLTALTRWSHRADDELSELTLLLDAQSKQLAAADASLKAMNRRVEHLESSEHGHCTLCGRVTDFPTITRCHSGGCTKEAA